MGYRYENNFFTDEDVKHLFGNAQNSLACIHEEKGPYKKIVDYLTNEMGMRDPLGIQTFYVGKGYDMQFAHSDIATAFFPSITNVWFCEDSVDGDSFGFYEVDGHEKDYEFFLGSLKQGKMEGYQELCDEKYFDGYTKITDYKKGDVLFFDSRTVHRKLNDARRRTLVLKFINSEDLEDKKAWDYSTIPPGPQWSRFVIFDRLRFIEGHEERKQFVRQTERLLGSVAVPQVDPREKDKKRSMLKRLLRRA
jgi:hypothetical protein